jgi:signal transduction histidine kinase/HPt (histidine-containing phosphotransfer) domain-containing protein
MEPNPPGTHDAGMPDADSPVSTPVPRRSDWSPERRPSDEHRSAEELTRKVRALTAALEEASLRAEGSSQSRESFLANVSHEIRTPLNGIIGFADLLRRRADASEAERMEWLEIIHDGGKHLLSLIDDILDLSKVDAGKLSIEQSEFSPAKIVTEVCAMLRPRAEEKGLKIEAAVDGPLPRTIRSDPTRLRQVLMNVAGNAIKFTPHGQVRIKARLDTSSVNDPKFIVEIQDTGIGIPVDKLESIFSPFTQADSSITRQYGGTGLGLAISRRLAEQLGGGITVESKEGHGTIFTCAFATGPLTELVTVDAASAFQVAVDFPRSRAEQAVPNHRVLVVDRTTAAPGDLERIVSSLPVADPDFREIVEDFVVRIGERLDAIEEAFAALDLSEVAKLAHWLKGTGGSVGFAAFTEPSAELEDLAIKGQIEAIPGTIGRLRQIASRIAVD